MSAAWYLAYILHYALTRANYERRLVVTRKYVRWTSSRNYELYNRHGNDMLLQALLLDLDGGDVVVDVGTNTGTCALAVAVSELSAQVITVEPYPEIVDQLRANIEVNDFDDRADLLDCGPGETGGSQAFHLSSYDELGSFSRDHASVREARIVNMASVSVRRLDLLIESGAVLPSDHLEVDVEGSGLNVLRGAEAILRERRPTVYFELHDTRGSHDEAVARVLPRGLDYELVPAHEGWVCEPRA